MNKSVNETQKQQAQRDYKSNLEPAGTERCYCCEHRKWLSASQDSVCTLLDIAIAVPRTSACSMFEDDGIPF